MTSQPQPPRYALPLTAGALLSLFAIAVLLSRLPGLGLAVFLPGLEPLSSTSALYLLLSGLALLAPLLPDRAAMMARSHFAIGALLCLITLAYMAGFIPHQETSSQLFPSHNACVAFFLVGVALIIGQWARSTLSLSVLFLLLIVIGIIALLGLTASIMGFEPLFGWSEHAYMSAYASGGLLLFTLAFIQLTWQRIRRHPIDPVNGISAVTGTLFVLIAFAGGIVIYTIAGAYIYNAAKDELHQFSHERAERIFIELELAMLRSRTLSARIAGMARPDEINALAQSANPSGYIEVIDTDSGTHLQIGEKPAAPLDHIQLSSKEFSLLRYADNRFHLRHQSMHGRKTVIAISPLRLETVIHDELPTRVDYKLMICEEGQTVAACQKEALLQTMSTHQFHDYQNRHGATDPPHLHLGNLGDLSDAKRLRASIHLPEFNVLLVISRDTDDIFGPLSRMMLYGLPLILLLFIAGAGLATWRITPLVRTIQKNEQRFRLLAENANDLISRHDVAGNFLYASPSCQWLLGYTPEEMIGQNITEFIHPEDRPVSFPLHPATSRRMPPYRVRRRNGDYIWFETTLSHCSAANGAGAELIAISRDITAQHHATEELRLSELRYRTLVEQASDGIVLHGPDRLFIEVNQAACEMLGYSRDELIGMHPEEFLLPDDHEDARIKRELMRDRTVASRRQLLRRDGSITTVDIHATGIEGGCIISIIRDISGQLRIEDALRDSRERWRSLVETAPDTIMTVNRNAELLFINRLAAGMLREETIGRSILDFISPAHRDTVRNAIERVFAGEEHIEYEIEGAGDNGNTVWWSSRCGPVYLDGRISSAIIVTRDISERHRIELALRNSERRNRSVIEVLAEGIVVHDRDGTIVSRNRAAQRILGHSADTANGRSPFEPGWAAIHEDGSPFPGEQHPAMLALATGRSQRDVIMGLLRPDNEWLWISVNAEPIWNDTQSEIVAVVSSFSDITEQRRTETELRESQKQLRALTTHLQEIREEEKAAIAREVHDELGSTMTALKLGMSWLESRLGGAEQMVYEKLESMSTLLEHAVTTVRRLVTQLRPTILDDLGLWAALEWQLREFATYSMIQVNDNLASQELEIGHGKSLAIYRVLQEALTNIAKHSGATRVRLDCWNRDGMLHIMLEDNGVGISETTTISPTSHGLRGMYERIASVGGALEILSTPGEGTVMTIEVPHD